MKSFKYSTRIPGGYLDGLSFVPSRAYASIEEPADNTQSHLLAIQQLKQTVETLVRQRGHPEDSAVTIGDMIFILERVNKQLKTLEDRIAALEP